MLEQPTTPEPKRSRQECGKLSLSLKKSRSSMKDVTNSGAVGKSSKLDSFALASELPSGVRPQQRFSKPISSPEREKASKGVIPDNTEAST